MTVDVKSRLEPNNQLGHNIIIFITR